MRPADAGYRRRDRLLRPRARPERRRARQGPRFPRQQDGLEAIELVKGKPGWLERLSFQVAPGMDLNDVVKELQKHGIKSEQRNGISPGVARGGDLHRSEGHAGRALCRIQIPKEDGTPSAFNILKLGHVAYRVLDVQKVVKFYNEVLGFRVSDWRGDYFSFPALQHRPSHAQFHRRREAAAASHRLRGAGLGGDPQGRPTSSRATRSIWSGVRAATSSATTSRPITATATWFASKCSPRWTR